MSTSTRRGMSGRILVDMNTQCDLLLPNGALPVTNRAEILPNIRRIMSWGRANRIPIVSSLESRRPSENGHGMPAYCVDHSSGQKKVPFTLMPRRIVFYGDNTMDVPMEPFRRYQQVIFTKRSRDFLANPKAERLFQTIEMDHAVVFGLVTEHCVKAAALSLLARLRRVAVVTDACGFWSAGDAELAFRQMEAKGAVLLNTDELISGAADERIRASSPAVIPDVPESAESTEEPPIGTHDPAIAAGGNGRHRRADENGNGSHRRKAVHLRPDRLTRLRAASAARKRRQGGLA